jgi:XTP/dITP diphosphohydrolase
MSAAEEFMKLVSIMERLRRECPWDRKQTPESLRQYILEEAHEAVESIDNEDWDELKKELGDLLLQIVFQAEIAREQQRFTLEEIIQNINQKLIRRHPHVFGDTTVKNETDVKNNWEKIKIQEENRRSILQGVPKNLSALLRSQRLQEKASNIGFDWEDENGIWEKIKEEIKEIELASRQHNKEEIQNEIGDLLFSIVNLARFRQFSAEDALRKSINKFIARFQFIEQQLIQENKSVHEVTLEEMDHLWEESKNIFK